jgi:hypothetical protein
MKRVFTICGAVAVVALAMPCQAALSTAPTGSGAISIDGVHRTTFAVSVSQTKFSTWSIVSGTVKITSLYDTVFRGLVDTKVASIDYAKDGSDSVVIHTPTFSFTDLTNWVPGYSSGIKYYWAVADIKVVKVNGMYQFGFTIYRADNKQIVADIPPMKLVAGSIQ